MNDGHEKKSLRDLWEAHALEFATWARTPGHDSYDRFHRDLFLPFLPPPGKLTLDIGCGEGRVARDLMSLGHRVECVDASETMVGLAREAMPEVAVHLADAAALPFPDGYADLVVMFMAIQDIDDYQGAIREAARVLVPGGRLVIATVHPLASAGAFESEARDSPFIVDASYLDVRRKADAVERGGLTMTFHLEHRSIEAYSRALEASGLVIEALREPRVPDAAARSARSQRWQRIPLFLHLRARRA
jgi:SAM-dependent methyltransferase